MYLQAYKRRICFFKDIRVVLTFSLQILEVIGSFCFQCYGSIRGQFWKCKKRCKVGSEGYLMIVIKSACVHIQYGLFSV